MTDIIVIPDEVWVSIIVECGSKKYTLGKIMSLLVNEWIRIERYKKVGFSGKPHTFHTGEFSNRCEVSISTVDYQLKKLVSCGILGESIGGLGTLKRHLYILKTLKGGEGHFEHFTLYFGNNKEREDYESFFGPLPKLMMVGKKEENQENKEGGEKQER